MFVFPRQQSYSIGGVLVGGQVNTPSVLAGTIFYDKEKIFSDEKAGRFDTGKTRSLIEAQDALAAETGIPCMVDVYAHKREHMIERLEFVSEATDAPMLVDSTEPEVRLAGVRYVDETGLADRIVYNSLNAGSGREEVAALRESDVDAAILLAFNPVDSSLGGRIRMLEDGGGVLDKGLLQLADDAGIRKKLVDTGITPLGEGAGSALRAVAALKARFGYPTGNGIHNVVLSWKWLKRNKDKLYADTASNCLTRMMGADFMLYGPMEGAPRVYAAMALTEALVVEAAAELGLGCRDGPLKRLFDVE